ncbi:DUF998 domain-containing protein [Streptomyces endocoffeicus]|uniref:DUF998 domain-containing protein n=1 Tax=Streptomyces endocoffeicus TaxID=2898945 RepID=UPI001E308924|nr:DUF998 domain-containing protein [Streptomyces endocoffeicus]
MTETIDSRATPEEPIISNLGVHGPSTLIGQYMCSRLAWVMNTGFFLFGITILAGVATLRDPSGGRRWATLVPATLLAAGDVPLTLFPGSGEALENGTGQFHSMGAFADFIGGSALAIVLGRGWRHIGGSPRMGRALITVGVIGLLSTVLYLAMIFTAGETPHRHHRPDRTRRRSHAPDRPHLLRSIDLEAADHERTTRTPHHHGQSRLTPHSESTA